MKIIAHRGASHYAPENTLAAFEKALDQKADGIELDVRLSKDGVPVVNHDATINRTSNGKGFIHLQTVDQLKKFDFGKHFSRKFRKERIATLEEVLQLVQDTDITLHIELKNGPVIPQDLESKTLALVDTYNMENKVIYSSFDHHSLQRLHKLDPRSKISLLFHMNLLNFFDYVDHTGLPIYGLHPNHFYVTEEMIAGANARKMQLNVYTVNHKKMAQHYQQFGIDGLITNDPLLLR